MEADPIKQDHEVAESGEDVIGCAADLEREDIFDTVDGYEDSENEEKGIYEGNNFNSVFALEDVSRPGFGGNDYVS